MLLNMCVRTACVLLSAGSREQREKAALCDSILCCLSVVLKHGCFWSGSATACAARGRLCSHAATRARAYFACRTYSACRARVQSSTRRASRMLRHCRLSSRAQCSSARTSHQAATGRSLPRRRHTGWRRGGLHHVGSAVACGCILAGTAQWHRSFTAALCAPRRGELPVC